MRGFVSATQRAGFTLIELLVVIAIISLLSSVVLVAMNAQRQRALKSSFFSNMRQFRVWQELYYSKHNQYAGSVCAKPGACKICETKTNSSWNWPPVNLGEPDPFVNGIRGLRLAYGGCMTYSRLTNPEGFELVFYMPLTEGREAEEVIEDNKILSAIFNMDYNADPSSTPCEWYDTGLATCVVQFKN